MEMTEEQTVKIEQIMRGVKCPRGFACHKSGFKDVCEAKVHDETGLIECVGADAKSCDFCARFGQSTTFCCCPVREYIARNLES